MKDQRRERERERNHVDAKWEKRLYVITNRAKFQLVFSKERQTSKNLIDDKN